MNIQFFEVIANDPLIISKADKEQSDSIRLHALLNYANANKFHAFEEVTDSLESSLIEFNTQGDFRQQIHLKLVYVLGFNDHFKEAHIHADSAIELSIYLKDSIELASSYLSKAFAYRFSGDHNSSLKYLEKNESILKKLKHLEGLSKTHTSMGEVYLSSGDYRNSLRYLLLALEEYKKVFPEAEGLPMTLNNIGVLYERQAKFEEALPYYRKCLHIYKTTKDSFRLVDVYNNIGIIHRNLQQVDSAIWYYQKCLDLKIRIGNNNSTGSTLYNLFNLYFLNNEIDSAERYIEWAIEIRKDAEAISEDDLMSFLGYSRLLAQKKRHSEALEWSKKALKEAKIKKGKREEEEAYLCLREIYEQMGLYEKAKEANDQYTIINKERLNNEQSLALERLQMQNQFQQKHYKDSLDFANKQAFNELTIKQKEAEVNYSKLQIRLLSLIILIIIMVSIYGYRINRNRKKMNEQLLQLNQKVNEQNETIQKSLIKKEVLLKEIHHRIKNNLQVVSSLLGLQSTQLNDERLLQIVEEGQNRIETIALVHTKLYQTEDLSSVQLEDYLEQLIMHVKGNFDIEDKVKVNILGDSIEVDMDTAVPLGLIVNELITNSLKYAFKDDGGNFEVLIKNEKGNCYLEIKDNGKGISEEIDWENSSTLGLKLIRLLSLQLKAKLSYVYDQGAKFIVEFENKHHKESNKWKELEYSS